MKRLVFLLMTLATPVMGVEPDEVLDDPVLEARARDISKGLRCLVCRNEHIDSSNAGIARDLRLLVRERLVAGDTDDEVLDFVVARYGEYVLLQPRMSAGNLALWAAGPLALIIGAGIAFSVIRRRPERADQMLSEEEEARLKALLEKD